MSCGKDLSFVRAVEGLPKGSDGQAVGQTFPGKEIDEARMTNLLNELFGPEK